MQAAERPQIDLVLIGGGHAHVSVLRSFGMKPVAGLRITLITDVLDAPYSGMLPGLIEKAWQFEDMHINLINLCQFAKARLIYAPVSDVNLAEKKISITGHPSVFYDVLSINSGAVPDLAPLSGAAEHAIAVKPISQFLSQLPEQVVDTQTLSIIGGGAAGVELALALRTRYSQEGSRPDIQLFARSHRLVPQAPEIVSRWLETACTEQNITIHLNAHVTGVERSKIITDDAEHPSDHHLVVTGVKPAPWVSRLDCLLDENGFIAIRESFQLVNDDCVFAAGDIASMPAHPRPKAGVFAVRAGPVLAENIRAYLEDRPLTDYRPQDKYLAIIGCADGQAIAFRGKLAIKGRMVWAWKKWIDKRFMDRFNHLPKMHLPQADYPAAIKRLRPQTAQNIIYCSGCGSKAGSDILNNAIEQACKTAEILGADPRYLPTPETLSDAAIVPAFQTEAGDKKHHLIQSVDTISQHISDPFIFGRIAALHAMSDIFVSGGEMISATAHITLLRGSAEIQQRDLAAKLCGALIECAAHHAMLIGGHTIAADEASMGLAVTGIKPEMPNQAISHLDNIAIILSKPIGTGIILAGQMQTHVPSTAFEAALQTMLHSNQQAAQIMMAHRCYGMTDVTGFGLARHLTSLLKQCHLNGAEIHLSCIPILPHALSLTDEGVSSSLYAQNKSSVFLQTDYNRHFVAESLAIENLLFDPQTAGGIVGLVPQTEAEQVINALHQAGYHSASIVGNCNQSLQNITLIN